MESERQALREELMALYHQPRSRMFHRQAAHMDEVQGLSGECSLGNVSFRVQ